MTADSKPIGAKRPLSGMGAALLTAAGAASAFAVSACCALPFLFATAGVGTAWLGGIALAAAPHRAALLGISALSLASGAVLLWRQRPSACSPHKPCANPVVHRLTIIGLFTGVILFCLGYVYV